MNGKTFFTMVAVTALAVLMVIILAAVVLRTERPKDPRFKVVERFEGGCIWVDTETGIGYGQIYDSDKSLFPLYDTDGELYRPNGWRDMGE